MNAGKKFAERSPEQQRVADLWDALAEAGAFKRPLARIGTWLLGKYGVADPIFLSPEEAREAAQSLEGWLARVRGRPGAKGGSSEYPTGMKKDTFGEYP